VYVPEELLKHLPPEYREAAEKRTAQGVDVLRVADADTIEPASSNLKRTAQNLRQKSPTEFKFNDADSITSVSDS
jgi:hypothetical protein